MRLDDESRGPHLRRIDRPTISDRPSCVMHMKPSFPNSIKCFKFHLPYLYGQNHSYLISQAIFSKPAIASYVLNVAHTNRDDLLVCTVWLNDK